MEAFEAILDILDNLIIDKAFDKNRDIKKRLPYIFIYYITIIVLCILTLFLSINLIKARNIIGYFLIMIFVILLILLILPITNWNKE